MKNNYFLLLSFFLFSFQSYAQDCNGRYSTSIFSEVDVSTVKYGEAVNAGGNNQELFMDIYQAENDTGTNRPVVIFAFGGSFTAGSRTSQELVDIATDLAKRGYVCASIDYRLASGPLDLIQEENLIKTVFRAVQDGKAAVRFFREDADTDNDYEVNPNQIFIGGTSAGGILGINLAYVDDTSKLTQQWRDWANEIGGFEGNSGNPGYSSLVQGAFGFAGAIGDTSYIDENSVPFYGSHATEDQTVQYGFGAPLNGFAPADLYGSGLIETRLCNLGIYSELDTYSGGDHPPLVASNETLEETTENLAAFLYNILECNPDNKLGIEPNRCDETEENPNSIVSFSNENELKVYPNPVENTLYFNQKIFGVISNSLGQVVANIDAEKIKVSHLQSGVYFIKTEDGFNKSFVKK